MAEINGLPDDLKKIPKVIKLNGIIESGELKDTKKISDLLNSLDLSVLKTLYETKAYYSIRPFIINAYIDKNKVFKNYRDDGDSIQYLFDIISLYDRSLSDFESSDFYKWCEKVLPNWRSDIVTADLIQTIFNLIDDGTISGKESFVTKADTFGKPDPLYRIKAIVFLTDKSNIKRFNISKEFSSVESLMKTKTEDIRKYVNSLGEIDDSYEEWLDTYLSTNEDTYKGDIIPFLVPLEKEVKKNIFDTKIRNGIKSGTYNKQIEDFLEESLTKEFNSLKDDTEKIIYILTQLNKDLATTVNKSTEQLYKSIKTFMDLLNVVGDTIGKTVDTAFVRNLLLKAKSKGKFLFDDETTRNNLKSGRLDYIINDILKTNISNINIKSEKLKIDDFITPFIKEFDKRLRTVRWKRR